MTTFTFHWVTVLLSRYYLICLLCKMGIGICIAELSIPSANKKKKKLKVKYPLFALLLPSSSPLERIRISFPFHTLLTPVMAKNTLLIFLRLFSWLRTFSDLIQFGVKKRKFFFPKLAGKGLTKCRKRREQLSSVTKIHPKMRRKFRRMNAPHFATV